MLSCAERRLVVCPALALKPVILIVILGGEILLGELDILVLCVAFRGLVDLEIDHGKRQTEHLGSRQASTSASRSSRLPGYAFTASATRF